jgi:alcohol dehydrogenase (cytochrome c)
MDRWLKAVDARSGNILWTFRAPSGIIGQPVTYQGSDGRQYVAILSGVGGWSGAIANAELDPRVRNGALGFIGATQDLPAYTLGGSTLLVFAIPQNVLKQAATQPDQAPPGSGQVEGTGAVEPDAEHVEFGR